MDDPLPRDRAPGWREPNSKGHAGMLKGLRFRHADLMPDECCDRTYCEQCGNTPRDDRDR